MDQFDKLCKTGFFLLFNSPDNIQQSDLQDTYKPFAGLLFEESKTADTNAFFNMLSYTVVELRNLRHNLKDKNPHCLEYLNKAIGLVKLQIENVKWKTASGKNETVKASEPKTKLTWTAALSSLVETVYALQAKGCFNKGEISLKDLFSALGELFNIKIPNFSRIFVDIKNRKKDDRTKFLDSMKDTLISIIEQSDEK